MQIQRIGIMGGTFDPIHYGHLIIAESAWFQFTLDKVIFIPSGIPPHKRELNSSSKHRFAMTEMAISGNPHFSISRIELDRKGFSYSVDTISTLLKDFGSKTVIYFIIGADIIQDLSSWYSIDKLMQLCYFITANRHGYDFTFLKKMSLNWQERIYQMEIPWIDISSTDIRIRAHNGKPIKYLLPENVENYINYHQLYYKKNYED